MGLFPTGDPSKYNTIQIDGTKKPTFGAGQHFYGLVHLYPFIEWSCHSLYLRHHLLKNILTQKPGTTKATQNKTTITSVVKSNRESEIATNIFSLISYIYFLLVAYLGL